MVRLRGKPPDSGRKKEKALLLRGGSRKALSFTPLQPRALMKRQGRGVF
jgi:hypothetical protein